MGVEPSSAHDCVLGSLADNTRYARKVYECESPEKAEPLMDEGR